MPRSGFRLSARDEGIGGWQQPQARYGPDGGRVYSCPICQDCGLVTVARSKPEETDAELLNLADGRTRHTYYCPGCRGEDAKLRTYVPKREDGTGEALLDTVLHARLKRWLDVKWGVLKMQSARPDPPLHALKQAVLRALGARADDMAARMQRARGVRVREAAREARRVGGGEGSFGETVAEKGGDA